MKSILNFIIVFSVGILLTMAAEAAGFDCSKAGSADEKTVCGDVEFSRLDELFNQRYAAQKKQRPTRISSIPPATSWRIGAIAVTTDRAF
ncbi:hypothetical protein [Rhizobium vallis]|uniref:hypothetical protein n=1 Tax=Rhizobium vallis TaxID=634290 RepID=UPI001FDF8FB9|nr:hypothetical protein [Rhizobium vallis]